MPFSCVAKDTWKDFLVKTFLYHEDAVKVNNVFSEDRLTWIIHTENILVEPKGSPHNKRHATTQKFEVASKCMDQVSRWNKVLDGDSNYCPEAPSAEVFRGYLLVQILINQDLPCNDSKKENLDVDIQASMSDIVYQIYPWAGKGPVTLFAMSPEDNCTYREDVKLQKMGLGGSNVVLCALHLKLRIGNCLFNKMLADVHFSTDPALKKSIVEYLNKHHHGLCVWPLVSVQSKQGGGQQQTSMNVNGPATDFALDRLIDTVLKIYGSIPTLKDRQNDMHNLAVFLRKFIYDLERGRWPSGSETDQENVAKDCKRFGVLWILGMRSSDRKLFSGNYFHEIITHMSRLWLHWLKLGLPIGLVSNAVLETHHLHICKDYFWAAKMATIAGRWRKSLDSHGNTVWSPPVRHFEQFGPAFHQLVGMISKTHLKHLCIRCGGVKALCVHWGCQQKSVKPNCSYDDKSLSPAKPPPPAMEFLSGDKAQAAMKRGMPSWTSHHVSREFEWPQREQARTWNAIAKSVEEKKLSLQVVSVDGKTRTDLFALAQSELVVAETYTMMRYRNQSVSLVPETSPDTSAAPTPVAGLPEDMSTVHLLFASDSEQMTSKEFDDIVKYKKFQAADYQKLGRTLFTLAESRFPSHLVSAQNWGLRLTNQQAKARGGNVVNGFIQAIKGYLKLLDHQDLVDAQNRQTDS